MLSVRTSMSGASSPWGSLIWCSVAKPTATSAFRTSSARCSAAHCLLESRGEPIQGSFSRQRGESLGEARPARRACSVGAGLKWRNMTGGGTLEARAPTATLDGREQQGQGQDAAPARRGLEEEHLVIGDWEHFGEAGQGRTAA